MKLKGSKKVVCECGNENYLKPGTSRACSFCGRKLRLRSRGK